MQEWVKWLRWSEEREEERKLLTVPKDLKPIGSKMLEEAIERAKADKAGIGLVKKIRVCEETRKDRRFAYMTRNCQPRPKNDVISEYDEVVGDGGIVFQMLLREKAKYDDWRAKHLQMLSKKMR